MIHIQSTERCLPSVLMYVIFDRVKYGYDTFCKGLSTQVGCLLYGYNLKLVLMATTYNVRYLVADEVILQ